MTKVYLDRDEWYSYHSLVTQAELEAANDGDEWFSEAIAQCVDIPESLWTEYVAVRKQYMEVLARIEKYDKGA